MVDTKLLKTNICSASKGLNIKAKREYIEKDSKKHVVMMNDEIDQIFTRKSKESFVYNSSSQVPIKTRRIMCKQAKRLGHTVEKCVMNESHLRTHI